METHLGSALRRSGTIRPAIQAALGTGLRRALPPVAASRVVSLGAGGGWGQPDVVSSMAISGTNSLEVPTIYKTYFCRAKLQEGIYQKICPKIWYSPLTFPLISDG